MVCSCMCYYWDTHSNRSRIHAGEARGTVNEDWTLFSLSSSK
jgi:hypothetical protein